MDNYSDILQELITGLLKIFHQSVDSIILYGSVAKGTETVESDIDIAVIVKSYTKDMHEQMIDFVVDLELEYDKVLSVLLIDYEMFAEWSNILPFYKNVKREGILLWPAA